MQQLGPYYIGPVTLKHLRNWLIDNPLGEGDTVLLHPRTFGDLVLEYREEYRVSMPDPYFLLGVFVDEAHERSGFSVPSNRLLVLLSDDRLNKHASSEQYDAGPIDDGRDVYRCGWCGNIVDIDGTPLQGTERSSAIILLEMRVESGTPIHGKCCPNGHSY